MVDVLCAITSNQKRERASNEPSIVNNLAAVLRYSRLTQVAPRGSQTIIESAKPTVAIGNGFRVAKTAGHLAI